MIDVALLVLIFLILPALMLYPELKSLIRKPKANSKVKETMSWPSVQLLTAYKALPVANRPMMNIEHILTALDIKYQGKEAVDKAFEGRYVTSCSWNVYSQRTVKVMPEYFVMLNDINEINNALKAQEYAIKMVSVAGSLEDVGELTLRLREERDLIKSVTSQLL